jgi:hypothetical protein
LAFTRRLVFHLLKEYRNLEILNLDGGTLDSGVKAVQTYIIIIIIIIIIIMLLPFGDQTVHQLLVVDGQGLNVSIRKTEYINIGSDVENIRIKITFKLKPLRNLGTEGAFSHN